MFGAAYLGKEAEANRTVSLGLTQPPSGIICTIPDSVLEGSTETQEEELALD